MTLKWLTPLVLVISISNVSAQCFSARTGSRTDAGPANSTTIDLSGLTDFGMRLYKRLSPANSTSNFFFSPYMLWSGLSLVYLGSENDAEKQLQQNLNVADKATTLKLWKDVDDMYKSRQRNNTLYTLSMANRIYFQNTIKLDKCLNESLHDYLRMLDLKDAAGSAKDINTFVSQTTKGRIPQVVQSQDLQGVLMVLVNAAFFKGTWKYQFKPNSTAQKEFKLNSRDSVQIDMMSQKGKFSYGVSRELGARVLELPYAGEDISMFILLPYASEGPPAFRFENMIKNLNTTTLRHAISRSNTSFTNVDVLLPKFKFTRKVGVELQRALQDMGIVDVFSGSLTGFDSTQSFSLGKAIHQAFVEVNEEGTEAAAVTISVPLSGAGEPTVPRVIEFHCTEPFVFLIHDNLTKNVLFMGAYKNPRG